MRLRKLIFLVLFILLTTTVSAVTIATALSLETTIKPTDKEITQAVIKDTVVKGTEQNNPIKVSVTVQNQGNIGITPFFQVDIPNSDKSQTPESTISEKKVNIAFQYRCY